jgi:hypothetical protein
MILLHRIIAEIIGVGHSTPYEEPQSYALAVKYLFLSGPAYSSSSSSSSSPTQSSSPLSPLSQVENDIPALKIEPFSARDTRNEYELPWIMRALVDSPQVKDLFPGELRELKEGVRDWRPVTKVLKEVKKRVSPFYFRNVNGCEGKGIGEIWVYLIKYPEDS